MRPKAAAALGGRGISRFPREVSPYVLGVSDRAGLWYTSRYRCTRWGLPHTPTASASRSEFLTRLNTRPARSPVNASTPPSRAAPHDSGPMWVATPLSCDFSIHYNLAGLAGAQENQTCLTYSVTLVGFVGADPELRQAKGTGAKFTVFSVATQRSWKNADDEWSSKTEWHRVAIIWNLKACQPAEYVLQPRTEVQGSQLSFA
jgi:hypothetical protein